MGRLTGIFVLPKFKESYLSNNRFSKDCRKKAKVILATFKSKFFQDVPEADIVHDKYMVSFKNSYVFIKTDLIDLKERRWGLSYGVKKSMNLKRGRWSLEKDPLLEEELLMEDLDLTEIDKDSV